MQAIILAAGESSRFWPLGGAKHKSLVKLLGKSLIEWTIEAVRRAGIRDIIIVQSPNSELEKYLGPCSLFDAEISYVTQSEALGMGNAIAQTESLIKDSFFVLNPYVFNADEFMKAMLETQKKTKAKMVLLGVKTDKPWNYGILDLAGDKVRAIVEKPAQGSEPSKIKATNVYLLPKEFFACYRRVTEHEYSYEDALALYMKENDVRMCLADHETPTLKYPWDLFKINQLMMDSLLTRQKISKSAKIAESAVIEGPVWIEENTIVFEHAVLKGPCYVGKGCTIGNNALIRHYTDLEDAVLIGANAEVTRSIFQTASHTHSGFFGDSIVGENVRIGAGTITANVRVDRREIRPVVKKERVETKLTALGAVIGRDTHLGVAVNLMPGVMIGANSKIGPNTLVRKNVPDNAVHYTEFHNVTKMNAEKSAS